MLLFQVPALPCPYSVNGDLVYVPAAECHNLALDSSESKNVYTKIVGSLGITKLTFIPVGFLVI